MDETSLNSRLSRISTIWTLLGNAQRGPGSIASDAQCAFIQRYQGAVYRYLLGALRDPDAADEVFQEFALRLVQGAFRWANPQRGRFRDYLKTTLIHLVTDYRNRLRRRPVHLNQSHNQPAAPPEDPTESEQQFLDSWREELLARTWESLEKAEREGGQPHYSALRFRVDHPDATSAETAVRLTEQLKPEHPFTDTGIRKLQQRAKSRFADVLLDEIAQSLDHPTLQELEQELIDVGLLPYCQGALQRRKGIA